MASCDHWWYEVNRKKLADGRWMVFLRCKNCGADSIRYS